MFLRAEGITLDFPWQGTETGHAAAAAAGEPLGGTLHEIDGKHVVRALDVEPIAAMRQLIKSLEGEAT